MLSNPALQLQVAAQQLTFEQTRFKYQHDLLDIEHQISKLKSRSDARQDPAGRQRHRAQHLQAGAGGI